MCGIFGVVNHKNSVELVIKNLEKLQYRGYDSCGIGYILDNKMKIVKACGTIKNLGNITDKSNICIGHTRWATHGGVSIKNAHPICDATCANAVVHNGIIENFEEIKKMLQANNYVFKTDTDTEVIAHLFSYVKGKTLKDKTQKVCNYLKGHYAFIYYNTKSNSIVICKKGNPLYLLEADDVIYISSDIPAICGYGNQIHNIPNGTMGIIKNNKIKYYNFNGKKIIVPIKKINLDDVNLSMGKYSHHMLKEIFDTPQSIVNTANELNVNRLLYIKEILTNKKYKRIYLIACGTAYHSCLMAKFMFKNALNIEIHTCLASEFRYEKNIADEQTICIYVSQSGETADTLLCAQMTKEKSCFNISVCNVYGSTLTTMCDYNIYTKAGRECAVASTKAFSTQIYAFLEICYFIENNRKISYMPLLKNLQILLNEYLKYKEKIGNILHHKKIIFIGRNIDYVTAREANLKFKEITYLPSFDIQAGELKHGTLSIIDEDTLVIVFNTIAFLNEKIEIVINEIKSRKGNVLHIGNSKDADIKIDSTQNPYFDSINVSVICQLLAFFASLEMGNNPDMPRNLAKSVTVE